MKAPIIYWIDLFSGAGGTTTGIHHSQTNTKVVACVNHDALAIESHKANHPDCLHFTEDVRDMKVVKALKKLVKQLRAETPNCIINIWASLECTNFSNAKGGKPRKEDSRTLANSLYKQYNTNRKSIKEPEYLLEDSYIQMLDVDYIFIENVREFMAWGPLDKNGKPISRKKGIDYIKWRDDIEHLGYDFEYKFLNSADFAAFTSRVRYFAQFSKKGLPISWPSPSHCKNPVQGGLFPNAKKWKAVREVLDLHDEGKSILTRKKPLVDATLKRIYSGLIKFVAGGETQWLLKYNSINKKTGKHNPPGLNEPSPVIAVQPRLGLASCEFLTSYYGNGGAHSALSPCPTIPTKDRFNKIFIDQQYGKSKPASADKPAGTITANPKLAMVSIKDHYLMNPGWGGHQMGIDQPSPVIIARQDKAPLYLVESTRGTSKIEVHETDTEIMIQIKEFMAIYGIIDIKMRMLKVIELKRIQGFPESYILKGPQSAQKKFIGNAVHPLVAQKLVEANYNSLVNHLSIAV